MPKQLLFIISVALLFITSPLFANPDSSATTPFSFSGFIEAYYNYDFGRPANNLRPAFVYSYNRNNEVNLNLGYLRARYTGTGVRANLALGVGTYMNANYAAEPGVLKNIYEAFVGVKLSKKKELWFNAGVLPSHIGFENAHSHFCWTLSRSIIADNSPYYESGATLGYTSPSGKWFIEALLLNGWQRIQKVPGNSSLCGGTQLTFSPSAKASVNYSTFIGNDQPDSLRRLRIFQNLYTVLQLTRKWGLIAGIDYGTEQKTVTSTGWNNWLGTAIIVQYKATTKTALAIRGEYYNDKYGVMIPTTTPNGFSTCGLSLNLDYYVLPNVLWRIEGKGYTSRDPIFTDNTNSTSQTNYVATTALSVTFP